MVDIQYVVDLHNDYQSGISINRIADEGFSAAIIKATEGISAYTATSMFDQWIDTARSRGMIPGAYHWLNGSDVNRQLGHFISRIGDPSGMICAVDVEDKTNPPSFQQLSAFVSGWHDRTGGHKLLLYSSYWWWSVRGWYGAHLTPYLWDSRYVASSGYASSLYENVPNYWWSPRYGGWTSSTMLQFTASANVAGRRIDASAFRGTRQELAALAGQEGDDMATEATLPWNGWDDDRTRHTVGGRGDAVALWETWSLIMRGLGVYQADGEEGTSFLATRLADILAGTQQLLAARDAEVLRDAQTSATLAALTRTLNTVADALNAGSTGTPLDTAAVLAAIHAVGEQVAQSYAEYQTVEVRRLQAQIAGLQAALDALQPPLQPTA